MKNELAIIGNFFNLLQISGDTFNGRVTKTGKRVIKGVRNGVKFSATQQPSGIIHLTATIRPFLKNK